MIVLEVHICDQRRSYHVTFTGDDAEAHALRFLKARSATHAAHELPAHPIDPRYTRLLDHLYPTCEHGLSANLCAGPQHYDYDDEERQYLGVI